MFHQCLLRTLDMAADAYFFFEVVLPEKESNPILFMILAIILGLDIIICFWGYCAWAVEEGKWFLVSLCFVCILECSEVPAILVWDTSASAIFSASSSILCFTWDLYLLHIVLNRREDQGAQNGLNIAETL